MVWKLRWLSRDFTQSLNREGSELKVAPDATILTISFEQSLFGIFKTQLEKYMATENFHCENFEPLTKVIWPEISLIILPLNRVEDLILINALLSSKQSLNMVTVSTGVSEELVVRAYQSGIYEHIQLPLYNSILQHKIALSLDIPPSVNVNVYGDSNRLKQILANLLNNATKSLVKVKYLFPLSASKSQNLLHNWNFLWKTQAFVSAMNSWKLFLKHLNNGFLYIKVRNSP